jgi:GT2 family glycosyltransferase
LGLSVVIRTRDKESYFERLLKNLASQTLQPSEIVIVDNYSSREKLKFLAKDLQKYSKFQKIKIIPVVDREFSHAYSTNLGVHAAENELVSIVNAHSVPISLKWLEQGVKHFKDPKVAGVSGFFIPHKEGFAFGEFAVMLYYFSQKMISHEGRFCTINCIIRKSLWKKYPFDENLPKVIPETKKYGLEDYDWSEEMVARGFKIIIDPSFSVYHSHGKGLTEIARNLKNYFIYKKFQRKISMFKRPRKSFSRVFQTKTVREIEISP